MEQQALDSPIVSLRKTRGMTAKDKLMPRPFNPSGVIVEFITIGRHIRVTAIDEYTGIEATIVGDPNMPTEYLKQHAVKKLQYVMSKKDV